MTAIIRPLGMLKSHLGEQKQTAVEAGQTVREAVNKIGIDPDLVAGVFVNGNLETKDYILQDGDEIKLLAVIGGG